MAGAQKEDELERNQRMAEALAFDLQTAQAVKTQSTELLANIVADYIVGRLEQVLLSDLPDDKLLARIHEIRGTLRALGEIGDSVKSAHTYLARKAVRDRMGLQPKEGAS
jgi:hypothetical protein